jgi:hypothetical protein
VDHQLEQALTFVGCFPVLRPVLFFTALLACATPGWAAKNPAKEVIHFQAEEFLAWPEAVDPASRETAERLVAERRKLIETLEAEDFVLVPTTFGNRVDEPKALQAWRTEEHQKIRALFTPGQEKRFREFRADWLERVEQARAVFPLVSRPSVSLQTTMDGEKTVVHLLVNAPSTLYRLVIDRVSEFDEGVQVEAAWVRPSLAELVGATPEPVTVSQKAEFRPKGNLELWVRPLDLDLPYRRPYEKVLEVPLAH